MGKKHKAKDFGKEFKDFLTKGNVISLATGVIIGGAFQAVVNSVVNDIVLPVVGMFTKGIDFSKAFLDLSRIRNPNLEHIESLKTAVDAGRVIVTYGTLITAVINFLIIGFVIFMVVKAIGSVDGAAKKVVKRGKPAPPPAAPTTKECPYCVSTISIKATRCPNCTSMLDEEAGGRE